MSIRGRLLKLLVPNLLFRRNGFPITDKLCLECKSVLGFQGCNFEYLVSARLPLFAVGEDEIVVFTNPGVGEAVVLLDPFS